MTQVVRDHRLSCDQRPSPNMGGAIEGPLAICTHFTAGRGFEQSLRTLRNGAAPKGKRVSAHLLYGRAGQRAQLVPFNRVAWHAGDSIWRGRKSCNKWMLGVEFDNAGKLSRRNGVAVTWFGVVVPEQEVFTAPDGTIWHAYSEPQLAAFEADLPALLAAYPSIGELVGHSDVKSTKLDPGPAFPMERYRALLAG